MSEFHRTLLGLHAQARRIDRDQALLGALGVGAFAYPHQIDSVHRMVTGTACRWLLADEVGLGKTIQAIMVMRALAAQSPRPLTVALVVPDDLVSQWEEELLCRGHVLAFENGAEGDIVGNPVVRLVRPSRLLAGDRITAEEIDLLLVDEFTKLQLEVRQRCITAARVIPNVLVLTATPALHKTATRRELMALLEPEADRVAQAEGRDILEVLAKREAHALEHHWGDPQEAGRRRAVEETHGLYRRLIRTARTDDYRDALLPGRVYQPVRLAPTDGDVGRASSARTYLAAAHACNLDIRHNTLLQVAGRSPRSLRDRLRTLQRAPDILQTAWQQIDGCLRDELGDAKLDALIDHLRELHARSPGARIVVVAEDNPTTDYLGDAIEKLTNVRVAKKRRLVAAERDLEVQIMLLNEALDDFISGEAKVLVAADVAREGHNLQFADEIIFFALPWSPPDIQQWIGRIDRLGTKGMPANRRISITPLVVEGSIEDNILEVLEGTGVFLRSEVFDESEWEGINDAISDAANGLAGASWVNAARTAQRLSDAHDGWLGVTRLPPSPRTALALECQARFRDRPYAAPMVAPGGNWYRAREGAAEKMIRLAREDYLDVRKGQHDHQLFKTMWYRARPGRDDFIIPDLDARSAYYHQAFITRRSSIECPPRSHVVQNDGQDRRLHFFDHGGSLHDGAVAAFERHAPATNIATEFTVEYPTSHPILRWEGRRLLLAVCELDFRNALRVEVNADAILGQNGPCASRAEQDARTEAARTVLTQFQADRRWMIDLCPPKLLFTALVVEDGEDMVVDADAVAAILDPIHDGECARQIGRCRSPLSEARLEAARGAAQAQIIRRREDSLAQACTEIRNAVERRCFAAQADADNFANAARAEIEAADMLDSRFEFNLARQRGARLTLDLAEAAWTGRATRLRGLEGALGTGARLRNLKYFWVVPRSANQDNPQARR